MNTLYETSDYVVDLSSIIAIEKHYYRGDTHTPENCKGYIILTDKTKWNGELDCYDNAPFFSVDEGIKLVEAWKTYKETNAQPSNVFVSDNFILPFCNVFRIHRGKDSNRDTDVVRIYFTDHYQNTTIIYGAESVRFSEEYLNYLRTC
jgi:hypothetical protein